MAGKLKTRGGSTKGLYRVELTLSETIKFLLGTGQSHANAALYGGQAECEAFATESLRYMTGLTLKGIPGELVGTANNGPVFLAFAENGLADIQMPPKRMSYDDIRLFY